MCVWQTNTFLQFRPALALGIHEQPLPHGVHFEFCLGESQQHTPTASIHGSPQAGSGRGGGINTAPFQGFFDRCAKHLVEHPPTHKPG